MKVDVRNGTVARHFTLSQAPESSLPGLDEDLPAELGVVGNQGIEHDVDECEVSRVPWDGVECLHGLVDSSSHELKPDDFRAERDVVGLGPLGPLARLDHTQHAVSLRHIFRLPARPQHGEEITRT